MVKLRSLCSILILFLTVILLAGCGENDAFTESISETETEPAEESTGKGTPRIVKTVYDTEDVVVAQVIVTEDGYDVDITGKEDSTAGIQKALSDCANEGGGTVFLPAGIYSISGSISIPAYVTLRGDWQDPDIGTEYGTIICVNIENPTPKDKNNPFNEGTFVLGGSGGVAGLTVYYPYQSLDDVKAYPPTFYTDGDGNNYMASSVKNCTVINGYLGIGACCKPSGAHEQLTVENFKGTFLYSATEVYNQADVGTWQNVVVSNKYWAQASASCMKKADADALKAYTLANTVGLKLGDLEWTEFIGVDISDCLVGIQFVEGKRIQFAGSFYELNIKNCPTALKVDDLDERWGMLIAHSTIDGAIENNTNGTVKLCDVEFSGDKKGIVRQCKDSTENLIIDYERSYTKPIAKLYWAKDLDKTGKTDVSAELQVILDKAGETGGVVYLSGGMYRFDNSISVPAGVELRGTAGGVNRSQGGSSNGTVFYCYYGDSAEYNEESAAFITLAGDNAGLNGIRIIYPENGVYDEDLYTSYAVRGSGSGVYVVNSSITASAYGIDFSSCNGHFIKKVTTCCYYKTFLVGGKGGIVSGCLQNGTVLTRTSGRYIKNWLNESNIYEDLFNPVLRAKNEYITVKDAEDERIFNTFCYGCANFLICDNSKGVLAVNIGCDNIGKVQTVMRSGEMTIVNAMRYNGRSVSHKGGTLTIYNRLTINEKNEKTYTETK